MHLLRPVMLSLSLFFYTTLFAQEVVEGPRDFSKLLPGQSEMNVRELVGPPLRIEPFYHVNTLSKDTFTYWVYSNQYTLTFRNRYYEKMERDRNRFLKQVQALGDPNNPKGLKLIFRGR